MPAVRPRSWGSTSRPNPAFVRGGSPSSSAAGSRGRRGARSGSSRAGSPSSTSRSPGRLVVLDHGLGLYTLYFHLDSVAVSEGERVERGQTIGGVGASGRATGPHLHFGAQVGAARVDPTALLGLTLGD